LTFNGESEDFGAEDLLLILEAEVFAWSCIEDFGDPVEVFLRIDGQIGALG
jgi:hypothetical protein